MANPTIPSDPSISSTPFIPPHTVYQNTTSSNSTATPDKYHNEDIFYEYVVFMIPCFLFMIIALIRMISLNKQPLPEVPIIKQVSYNIKRGLSIYMAVVYAFQLFLASSLTPDVYWVTEYRYGAAAYLLGIVAWIISHQLLGKEVERGIYQRFYSLRMFWILQFIVVIIKMSKPIEQHFVPQAINILKIIASFYLTLYALAKPFDSDEADELNGQSNKLPLIRAILVKIENLTSIRKLAGEKAYVKSEPLLYSIASSENENQAEQFKTFLKLHNIKSTTSAQAGDWLKYLPIVTCRISEELVANDSDPSRPFYEIKTNVDDDIFTKLHDYKDFLGLEAHIKKRYSPLKVTWIDRDPPEFEKLEASKFADETAFQDARRENLERYLNTLGTDPRYMNEKVLDFLGILEPHKSAFMKYFAFLATKYTKSVPMRESHQSIEMGDLTRSQQKKNTAETFVSPLKVRCSHFQKSIYGDHYEYIILVEDEKNQGSHGNSWSIIRSYSDFKDLNEKLERVLNKNLHYLTQFVPKPREQRDTTDEAFIKERMRGLDMYISVLLKQPIYHTDALYEFLEYDPKRGTRLMSVSHKGSYRGKMSDVSQTQKV